METGVKLLRFYQLENFGYTTGIDNGFSPETSTEPFLMQSKVIFFVSHTELPSQKLKDNYGVLEFLGRLGPRF